MYLEFSLIVLFLSYIYLNREKQPKHTTFDNNVFLQINDFKFPSISGRYNIKVFHFPAKNYEKFSYSKVEQVPSISEEFSVYSEHHYHTLPIFRPSHFGYSGISVFFQKKDEIALLFDFSSNDIVDLSEIKELYENFLKDHHQSLPKMEFFDDSDDE